MLRGHKLHPAMCFEHRNEVMVQHDPRIRFECNALCPRVPQGRRRSTNYEFGSMKGSASQPWLRLMDALIMLEAYESCLKLCLIMLHHAWSMVNLGLMIAEAGSAPSCFIMLNASYLMFMLLNNLQSTSTWGHWAWPWTRLHRSLPRSNPRLVELSTDSYTDSPGFLIKTGRIR